MIACYFSGRLGNQLFRYAYVRQLWEERGRRDELVFNFRRVCASGSEDDGFRDSLSDFNCLPYRHDDRSLVLHYGTLSQRIVYGLYRICEKVGSLFRLKWNAMDTFRPDLLKRGILLLGSGDNDVFPTLPDRDTVFVNGFFENRAYFDTVRPALLRELRPRWPLRESSVEVWNAVGSTESVCVSVRRGDYLSPTYREGFFLCDADYFRRAVSEMQRRVPQAQFVFFSDDIEWVRRSLPVPEGSLFERGDAPVWEKLRLMSACRHFIISNSSFSWWAQYLSDNTAKVVISPDRWFNNPEWKSCLVEEGFVKAPSKPPRGEALYPPTSPSGD